MCNAHGVVSHHEICVIMIVQNRNGEAASQGFGHLRQAVKVRLFCCLDQLNGNVAVRFHGSIRKPILLPQQLVVVDHTVVGQGKNGVPRLPGEGVIVHVVM